MANVESKGSITIDLTKVDKENIVKLDKNGNPLKYKEGKEARDLNGNIKTDKNGVPLGPQYYTFDFVKFDQKNDFGSDIAAVKSQTKEDRDNKVKAEYIGNGKTYYTANTPPPTPSPNAGLHPSMQQPPPAPVIGLPMGDEDDLPF